MFYSDNPLADFNRWDSEQSEWLAKLPKCSDCGEPIQEEFAYYIHDGWLCEHCVETCRKEVPQE